MIRDEDAKVAKPIFSALQHLDFDLSPIKMGSKVPSIDRTL